MTLPREKIEKIVHLVIRTVYERLQSFPSDASGNRNDPFRGTFLNAFEENLKKHVNSIPMLVSLESWLHGLSTTLGQSFFEQTAHVLCSGQKKKETLHISESQDTAVSNIITELKNGSQKPDIAREESLIYQVNAQQSNSVSKKFTADCFFENNGTIVAIELKAVKPNRGESENEKRKILHAKAGLKNKYPDKKIRFCLGIPFDPQSDTPTGHNKDEFMDYSVGFKDFFHPSEVLLADELWDFLSGDTNTMQQILDIVKDIATADFMNRFNFINEKKNRGQKELYLEKLEAWKLYSEMKIITNGLHSDINTNRESRRTFSSKPFSGGKTGGEYKKERLQEL